MNARYLFLSARGEKQKRYFVGNDWYVVDSGSKFSSHWLEEVLAQVADSVGITYWKRDGLTNTLSPYADNDNVDIGTGKISSGSAKIGSLTGVLKASAGDVSGSATTSDLPEGANQYYTEARFNTAFADKDTDDLEEGVENLYYTEERVDARIDNKIENDSYSVAGEWLFSNPVVVPTPTLGSHAVNKDWVEDRLFGLDWQTQVKAFWDASVGLPEDPVVGDRYICEASGYGWTENRIYEWQGGWLEYVPREGATCWVDEEDGAWTFNSAGVWVKAGSTVTHNNTSGKQGGAEDEYYHLSANEYSELHVGVTLDNDIDNVITLSTQEFGLVVQNPNLVFAGPVSGAAAVPTFRTLVAGDVPDLSATYLPLTGGTMTGDLYMGKNGVYFDRGSVGVDFERGSGGMYFDHGELKFYDTLLSLTLSEMGLPKLITLVATGQTEGDKHLTDALWAVSKSKIDTIRIVTASTNWDLYLLQNDNGYAADDARIPKLQLMKSGNGNAVIQLGQAYEDEDGTNEVHLYFNDIAGSNTFSVYIQGYQLR